MSLGRCTIVRPRISQRRSERPSASGDDARDPPASYSVFLHRACLLRNFCHRYPSDSSFSSRSGTITDALRELASLIANQTRSRSVSTVSEQQTHSSSEPFVASIHSAPPEICSPAQTATQHGLLAAEVITIKPVNDQPADSWASPPATHATLAPPATTVWRVLAVNQMPVVRQIRLMMEGVVAIQRRQLPVLLSSSASIRSPPRPPQRLLLHRCPRCSGHQQC